MSLQVWLPLNGNLENQGLADVTVTNNGATVDNNGKIGKCYSFDGTNDYITLICQDFPTIFRGLFSITFWVCSNDDGTRSIYFGNYGISGGGNWFNLEKHTANEIRFWWNDGNPDKRFNTSKIIQSDGWTHFALTKNGGVVKTYLNGELIETYTNENLSTDVPSTATTFRIGGDYRTSGDLMFNGKMNDFRLYDHALSAKEVKELAKGLVLHYPLNRQGWGQDNLIITNSMAPTSGTSGWSSAGTGWAISNVISSSASNGHAIRCTYSGTTQVSGGIHHPTGVDKTTLTTGAIYTLSARIRASKACIATFHNELMTKRNTINLTTDWKTYSYSCAIDNTKSYHSNVIYVRAEDAVQNMWIECDWIKLEEGTKSTPWCPNSSDALATTMGLNEATEYDCSGFGNNGTRTDTFSWTSDTPRYNVSQVFSGSQRIEAPFNPGNSPTFTVAGWFYHTGGTTYYGAKNDYNTFICLEGSRYFVYNSPGSASVGNWTSTANTWQHVVLVHDAATKKLKLYINGSFVSEVTTNGTICGSDILDIGGRQGTAQYIGKISDFRIYATPLSEKDIKELYTVGTAFDKQGRVMTYEVVEV